MAKISARGCCEVARAKKGDRIIVLRSDRKILERYTGRLSSGYTIISTLAGDFYGPDNNPVRDARGWADAWEGNGAVVKRTDLGALRPCKAKRKAPADPMPRRGIPWQKVVDSTHVAESNLFLLRRLRRLSIMPEIARARWHARKQNRKGISPRFIRQYKNGMYRQAVARHKANREQYKAVMGHSPYPSEAMIGRAITKGWK